MGKTTLLQAFLQQLDGKAEVAFISHFMLSFDGILEYMLVDFGIAATTTSHAQRLLVLNNFLIQSQRAGQNAVLIMDQGYNRAEFSRKHLGSHLFLRVRGSS